MPSALSETGQHEIEEMIDELAATSQVSAPSGHPWFRRIAVGGIAAAGVAAACFFPMVQRPAALTTATAPSASSAPGFVLVGESDRVESMTDEGWLENQDGSTMQATRLSVVEENTLRDVETGIVISISEPREEILLMPVSAF
ncbi:MAG: hypothetical protein WCS43_18400 [Verrucomicrobiota bacterium]